MKIPELPPHDDPFEAVTAAVEALVFAQDTMHELHAARLLRDNATRLLDDVLVQALDVENAPQAVVATILGVSQQAVSALLKRARERLAEPAQPFAFAEHRADGSVVIRRHGGGS